MSEINPTLINKIIKNINIWKKKIFVIEILFWPIKSIIYIIFEMERLWEWIINLESFRFCYQKYKVNKKNIKEHNFLPFVSL